MSARISSNDAICSEGVARVFRGCVEGVSRVCRGCVEGVSRVFTGCVEGVGFGRERRVE